MDHGFHDEAEQLFIKTLERRQRLLGEKDSLTQASIADLWQLYERSNQLDKLKMVRPRTRVHSKFENTC
ncbi:MAG: tetratricopeptide repeat protein [Planctomycetes bacterium]|nr:tetratricopeptide repeat protein [Planctomycetota bacterium]